MAEYLRAFFAPRSIALIGASADPQSISARPLRMLGQHGFPGAIYPVNPKYSELLGRKVFASITDVPDRVDLALIAVPARTVPSVLQDCIAANVRHALVLSSGFGENGTEGKQLQQTIAELKATSPLRISGPNGEGFYYPAARVCATFSPAVDPEHGFPTQADAGPVAVVSQSGGLGFALLNRGRELGLRFGAVVSTGNEVDLTFLDYVDFLLEQPEIRVVLGFVEGLRDFTQLEATTRRANQLRKPLIVAKIGRSEVGRRAARAHTGSDVGDDNTYDAAFQRLGILRVDDVDEMLDLAAVFSSGQLPKGPRVAVLTTSGGAGAWLADACAMRGLDLPMPPPELQSTIASFIPSYGSTGNPVDITAQAVFGGGFERALGLLAGDPTFDAVVGVGSMVREDRFLETLPDLRSAIEGARASILFYAYTQPSAAVVAGLTELGIPCYPTPVRAARALAVACAYHEFVERVNT